MSTKHSRLSYILLELGHHLPYSIFSVVIAMIIMGILTFLSIIMGVEEKLPEASHELFHIFHPAHILFSSITTTAMFWKHDNRLGRAIVVGSLGSVMVCGLSDYAFPFLGGLLFGLPMEFHACIIHEPGLVWPFVFVGVFTGLFVNKAFEKSTQFSHSAHIFVSSMASLLYLIGYGVTGWIDALGMVFGVTVLAVVVPCCTSDIIFPLACTHKYCDHS